MPVLVGWGRAGAALAAVVAVLTGCAGGPHTTEGRRIPGQVAGVDCLRARCLALSYDDGPSPYTAPLLRVLEGRHTTATFFLIGRQTHGYRPDVRREDHDGDAIGDHTVSHPDLTRLSSVRVRYQITRAARQIAAVDGLTPTMLRPPYGAQDARIRSLARTAGLSVVMWNDDPRDWQVQDASAIERQVLEQARRGGIVELHDRYAATVAATPRLIDALRARGYTLVTIPQLFAHSGGMRAGAVYFHGP